MPGNGSNGQKTSNSSKKKSNSSKKKSNSSRMILQDTDYRLNQTIFSSSQLHTITALVQIDLNLEKKNHRKGVEFQISIFTMKS